MKTTSPVKSLKSEAEKYAFLKGEVPKLEMLFCDAKARKEKMEASADLTDMGAMTEIAALQTLGRLEERRMEAARQAFDGQHTRLLAEATEFVKREITPRHDDLKQRVIDSVQKQLREHCKDEAAVRGAAAHSTAISTLNEICRRAEATGMEEHRPFEYAEKVIAVWEELDAFEKTYLA